MKTLPQIRAEIEASTPDPLTQRINGETVEFDEDGRNGVIDKWAQNRFDQQARDAQVITDKTDRRVRMNAIRQKLGLSKEEFRHLREAMQYPPGGEDA